MSGKYLKLDEEYTGTWKFMPKRKGGSVTVDDIERELFDMNCEGGLYGILFKVPYEFPADNREYVEVLEPEQMLKSLCQWEGYRLMDKDGNEIDLNYL